VYAANSDNQTISNYSRNSTTGLLTAKAQAYTHVGQFVSVRTASEGPQHIAVSEDGRHVYTSGGSSAKFCISQFHVNP
jgi:6-phosphogluconolactonase (cycloisomerase 2 family)